jgi:hypothetical protein
MANTATEWVFESLKKDPGNRRPEFVRAFVDKAIELKKFDPARDIRDLRSMAAEACGPAWHDQLQAYAGRRQWAAEAAADAVGPDTFAALVGTTLARRIEANYNLVVSQVDQMFSAYPTPDSLEEITHVYPAQITGGIMNIAPVMPYPMLFNPTGYSITIPKPEKRGGIVQVALEQVVNGKTAEVFDAADAAGKVQGHDQVERKLKVVLGITNNYTRNGTTYGTYQTATPWINRLDDFDITNGPAELDRLEQLFNNMVDPVTGKEVVVNPTGIFIPSAGKFATKHVLGATELRTVDGTTTIISDNPMGNLPVPITDRKAKRLLVANGLTADQANSYLLYGDFRMAFANREVRPAEVLERNNEIADDLNFRNDVVYAVKLRTWDAPFVKDPTQVTLGRKM